MVDKRKNFENLLENFFKVSEKHCEMMEQQIKILTEQQEAFQDNTINKECKSKIYEKINDLKTEIVDLQSKYQNHEELLIQMKTFFLGDGMYTVGIIDELKNIKKSIKSFEDFIKERTVTKKTMINIYGFLSGIGGVIVFNILQKLIK